jgi:CHAT domain-containing protein
MRLVVALTAIFLAAAVAGSAQEQPTRSLALDHLARGAEAFRGGETAHAIALWREASRLARQNGALDVEVQAEIRQGEALRVAGHLGEARDKLRAALTRAEQGSDPRLVALAIAALGGVELASGHLGIAEALLLRAKRLFDDRGDARASAGVINDLASLAVAAGRVDAAASRYTEAISAAERAGDAALAATGEINAARLARRRGDGNVARMRLSSALDRLERLPASYDACLALVSIGSIMLERDGKLSTDEQALAVRALTMAVASADQLRSQALASQARGELARLYQRTGRTDEAVQLTDRALFAAQQAAAPELSFRWDWQQASLARQRGQIDTALTSYRRAVAGLQSVRRDIPVEYSDGRSSYQVTFGPLYREFSDLLLRRAAVDPAHAAPLMREARDTIETLKESELQDYFRDSCVTSFEARRQSIDVAAAGTAILYPITLPDRLELLVSFGQEQRQFTIAASERSLRQEVEQFRELLEKRTTNEYLVPARRLYELLIRPIEPSLAAHRIDTLVLVPDAILRIAPFAALHDGSRFLIERYAIAIAPSMHLIDQRPLAASDGVALVLGISKSVRGFIELPDVPGEVTAVQQMGHGKGLIDEGFTSQQFASELKLRPYKTVHIASHGQFGSGPKQTFVVAYDRDLTMDNLEAAIKYGEYREDPLELLVLSACQTAAGDDRAALGLAGLALKSGARSAVASLWHINDEATRELMIAFYRELQSGKASKAEALRTAQRYLAATEHYDHPAYWAPFLLIGNWL